MTDKERKKIKLHFKKPYGLLSNFYIPVSFEKKTNSIVCYVGYGDEANYLGHGKTEETAFENLIKTVRQGEGLRGKLFEDWAESWNKIGKIYKANS